VHKNSCGQVRGGISVHFWSRKERSRVKETNKKKKRGRVVGGGGGRPLVVVVRKNNFTGSEARS